MQGLSSGPAQPPEKLVQSLNAIRDRRLWAKAAPVNRRGGAHRAGMAARVGVRVATRPGGGCAMHSPSVSVDDRPGWVITDPT